jgi:hypothetical protein
MKFGFAVLACLLVCGAAHAQRISKVNGSRLLTLCSGGAGRTSECDAYLSGVADAYAVAGKPGGVCIPLPVTGVQLRLVATKYLHDHPQDLERPAGEIASHAFMAAFPCR